MLQKPALPGLATRLRKSGSDGLAGRGGLAFFVAFLAVNVSNLLFSVIASRLLGPASFGALSALLTLTVVLVVPVNAVQAAVTQAVAQNRKKTGSQVGSGPTLAPATTVAALASLAVLLLGTGFSPVVAGFLHIDSLVPVILVGAWLAFAIVGLVPQGALFGEFRFAAVAAALLTGAVARLGIGAALIKMGMGLDGAMAATVLGMAITAGMLLFAVRDQFSPLPARLKVSAAETGLSVLALVGFSVFVGIDTVLARHFLSASASGYYAAAATAARLTLFLAGAIALVAFPHFVSSQGNRDHERRLLREAVGAVVAIGLGVAIVLLLASHLVIETVFGAKYIASAGVVGTLGVAAMGMGTISLLIYFHLARRSVTAAAGWLGAAGVTVGVAILHSGPEQIAAVTLGVTAAVLLVMAAGVAFAEWWRLEPGLEAEVRRWAETDGDIDLTLVVPYYNPGAVLRQTIEEAATTLGATGVSFEIIAVSDGSTDGSGTSLSGLLPGVLKTVGLPDRQGKGQALRAGLALGRGRYLGFIDADGDLPATLLGSFVEQALADKPDLAVGSKRHPDSRVHYPHSRRLYSWGFQLLTMAMFRLNVRDTQTGIKLVRRDVMAAVLPRMVEKRFAFDLELLVVARRLGFDHIVEFPVEIRERFSSTISIRAVGKILSDTVAIFYRMKVLHFYEHPYAGQGEKLPDTAAVEVSRSG